MRTERRGGRDADIHPTAFVAGGEVHLLGQSLETAGRGLAQHLYSRDGRRFSRARSLRAPQPGISFVGSIVRAGDGFRAYVSGDRGIRSLVSKDARQWAVEEGLRIPDGWDPAVVELKDRSFLMLYCTEGKDQSSTLSPIVGVSPELRAPAESVDGSLVTSGPSDGATGDVGGADDAAAGDDLNDASSDEELVSPDLTGKPLGAEESGAGDPASGVYPSVDDYGYGA